MPKVTQPGPEPRVTVPSPRAGPPCPRASRGKSHRTPVTTLRPAEAVCSGWATASLSQSRMRQQSLRPRPCGLRSPVSLRGCHLCRRRGRSRDAQGLARPFQVSAGFLLTRPGGSVTSRWAVRPRQTDGRALAAALCPTWGFPRRARSGACKEGVPPGELFRIQAGTQSQSSCCGWRPGYFFFHKTKEKRKRISVSRPC